jgi:hypothetical protein
MTLLFPHPARQFLFALLSLADLALTWWLLSGSNGRVYEANPMARWLLEQHGWAGLATFKAGIVLLVLALCAVVARSRPRAAGRALTLGCAALALVVLYSVGLCRTTLPLAQAGVEPEELQQMAEINRQARAEHQEREAFQAFMEELGRDVLAGRYTLREGVDRLAASKRGQDSSWLHSLIVAHHGRPRQECLAAVLMAHTVRDARRHGHEAAWRITLRLEREFQRSYGSPPPIGHRALLRQPAPAPLLEEGERTSLPSLPTL